MQEVPISRYMTLTPKTINHDQTLEQAAEYMRKLHVRHLPVTKHGHLLGVVSDRDIKLMFAFRELGALNTPIETVVTPNPYVVESTTLLSEVAQHMADEKYGCVLVMEDSRLIGIFTAVDALRALSDVFRELSKQPDPEEL